MLLASRGPNFVELSTDSFRYFVSKQRTAFVWRCPGSNQVHFIYVEILVDTIQYLKQSLKHLFPFNISIWYCIKYRYLSLYLEILFYLSCSWKLTIKLYLANHQKIYREMWILDQQHNIRIAYVKQFLQAHSCGWKKIILCFHFTE